MTTARERRLVEWADLVDEDVSDAALAAAGEDGEGEDGSADRRVGGTGAGPGA
jgi:hypothetical protein